MKVAAQHFAVSDIESLIKTVEENTRKQPKDKPRVIKIRLWDTCLTATGTPLDSYNGTIELDTVRVKVLSPRLSTYVRALVRDGKPFITRTGRHESACTIRWTCEIEDGAQFIKAICSAIPDLGHGRTEIISFELWSGRMMVADFWPGEDEDFDIIVRKGRPDKPEDLNQYFLEMLEEGSSFTMKLQANGVIYPVRWRIK